MTGTSGVQGRKPERRAKYRETVAQGVRAVTFDAGGTLIECWPSVGHLYAEVAARYEGKGFAPDLLNRRFAVAWRGRHDFRHTRREWKELVDTVFAGLTKRRPSQTFFPELYERFANASAWHVFADVIPALEKLAASGLRLGIISNWDARLRPLLRELKLAPYFDAMVVSCEVGVIKPSPRIFAEAARRLRLPRNAILHVGDSLEMDAQGARAAGLEAWLLARGANPAPAGAITSLLDLCSYGP